MASCSQGYLWFCYTSRVARNDFDARFFSRYYGRSPIHTKARLHRLASAIDDLCSWWQAPVRSMLDVGAGVGHWSNWYRSQRPRVRVVSTDVSEHACRRYGHERLDIGTQQPRGTFDLVVCMSVLQYLDDVAAKRAIGHLAAATRNVLYFEVPTRRDMNESVDASDTDARIHVRSGDWYARRLQRHFVRAGAGLWVRRGSGIVLYELEAGR